MKMQTFDQYSFHFMSKSEHQNSKKSKKIEVIDESEMKKERLFHALTFSIQ